MDKEKSFRVYCLGLLISGLLFAVPSCLSAQKKVSEAKLDQIYDELKVSSAVVSDSVRYTGGDIRKAGGFCFQRGFGSGWTKGCRLTLDDISEKKVKRIRDVFESFNDIQYVNLSDENGASTFSKKQRPFICTVTIMTRKGCTFSRPPLMAKYACRITGQM